MVAQTTFGLLAPAGTPTHIIERLNQVTQQVMADEAFQSELMRIGFEPMSASAAKRRAQVFQDELVRWTPIIKAGSKELTFPPSFPAPRGEAGEITEPVRSPVGRSIGRSTPG